ncbi:uncharacterized protein EI97DRAFT_445684 [Westerdykella ornata]|uniref:Uncharacterized protein n=1 Tax=Westerdykella ornata TaxID=318751 RepID=A0A6A6J9F9_WESOR|nr:uncharacterized protein EI97DRAFT_445684 [Westerdykella ornata]KAF2272618.1 hypothetical protein EI97DRAFT_445684 [Westerdykella ornata]
MFVKNSLWCLWSAAALALCAITVQATPTRTLSPTITKRAVTPTEAGQIGVNAITDVPASEYTSVVGPATEWYDENGNYKKIGVNTEYLTEISTTVESRPTIIKPAVTLVTAAAAIPAAGIEVGDVHIVLAPKLKDAVQAIADEAVLACPLKKRQTCSAAQRFAEISVEELQPGGRLAESGLSNLADLLGINDAFEALAAALGTTVPEIAAAVSEIASAPPVIYTLVFLFLVSRHGGGILPKVSPVLNIPAHFAGKGNGNNGGDNENGCPADAPKGKDAPVCPDDDCKGPNEGIEDKRFCSAGKWKGCSCIQLGTVFGQEQDPLWLRDQQEILQWVVDNGAEPERPWCYPAGSPNSGRTPAAWCDCAGGSLKYEQAEKKEGEEWHNPCPWTEQNHPEKTVTFTDPPPVEPEMSPKCYVNPCPDVDKAAKEHPWVHLGRATEMAHKFCKDYGGKTIGSGKDTPVVEYEDLEDHKTFDGKRETFWVGAKNLAPDFQRNLDEKDCITAMDVILNGCDTCTNDRKFGASLQWKGVEYHVRPQKYIPCITC